MKKILSAIIAPILFTSLVANATPVTWSFGGTVVLGYGVNADGRKVTGAITLDLSAPTFDCGGVPRATDSYICLVKQSGGTNMYGSVYDGIQTITAVEEPNAGGTNVAVYRNSVAGGGDYNQYYVGASNSTVSIDLLIQDNLGLSSKIFAESNGGVAWNQQINWFPGNAASYTRISNGSYGEVASLDWVTTTIDGVSITQTRLSNSSEIPEPSSLLALIIGLIALGASFRLRR